MWSYEYEKNKKLQPGTMLLAEPFMFDENFKRTVVLICSYHEDEGVMGLILNRPINLRLNDVLDGLLPFKSKIYLGGPVGTDTLQFIHSLGDEIEGTIKLNEHLYWGGNFEQLCALMNAGRVKESDVRFFLGYSGWGYGQLQNELKENSWIVTYATYHYVFQSDVNTLWKTVMQDLGGVYQTMASYPENPILN
jgi:Putative transcriptional regulator